MVQVQGDHQYWYKGRTQPQSISRLNPSSSDLSAVVVSTPQAIRPKMPIVTTEAIGGHPHLIYDCRCSLFVIVTLDYCCSSFQSHSHLLPQPHKTPLHIATAEHTSEIPSANRTRARRWPQQKHGKSVLITTRESEMVRSLRIPRSLWHHTRVCRSYHSRRGHTRDGNPRERHNSASDNARS